jgi:tripartite-type tricarboxylate transporter receptor subunit TctC
MKKIISIIILSIFFTTSLFAKNIEILSTSTLKGPQGVVINAVGELTKNSSIEFVAKQTSGCGEAVDLFNNSKEPIAIIWSDTMIKHTETTKQNCIINFEKAKPVAVTFSAYDVCVAKGVEIKPGTELILGNNKFNPQTSQLSHMNGNNKNIKFKNVTYEGSGPIVTALINKEINVGITATANAASAIRAGSIDCLYSTGSSKYGQKPLSDFAGKNALSEFKLGMMLFVKNMSAEQIAGLEKSLAVGFIDAMDKQDLINSKVGINKNDLDKFIATAKTNVQYQ